MTRSIKYVYEKDKGYVDMHVTGLFGGTTPHNTLSFYMYDEISNFPKSETVVIGDNGHSISESLDVNDDEKLRNVKCLVHVPLHIVPSFAAWMMEHYNKQMQQNLENSNKKEVPNDESK